MTCESRNRAAGFTLVEMLVVIFIIGLLAGIGAVAYNAVFSRGEEAVTKAGMAEIQVALGEMEREIGSYPPGVWSGFGRYAKSHAKHLSGVDGARLEKASETNAGVEILMLACQAFGVKPNIDEKFIEDTDGDGLMEYLDAWRNPIVYICNLTDDPPATVMVASAGDDAYDLATVSPVGSKLDERKPRGGYQLISAGVDGMFGSDDDIVVFGRD